MRKKANAFGLATCTISCIVRRVRQAISTKLSQFYIKAPEAEKYLEAVQGFPKNHAFPQYIGTVDETHIPIIRPKRKCK